VFKIVSDQAKNVKKAFSSTPECVDIVEMTLKLLNRQRKIDLIAQQKAARVQNENILEEIAVEELEADIIENNTISPINLKERRTSLRRDQVLNIFEGDNDELTFSATNSNDQQCEGESTNQYVDGDGSANATADFTTDEEAGDECPFEAKLRELDEEHSEFITSMINHKHYVHSIANIFKKLSS